MVLTILLNYTKTRYRRFFGRKVVRCIRILPDLVGTYWKGSLTPKATSSDTHHTNKIIDTRGVSIYRIQNGKMVETWHRKYKKGTFFIAHAPFCMALATISMASGRQIYIFMILLRS